MQEVLIKEGEKKALISISALLICTDGWIGGNVQKEKIDPEHTLKPIFHPNRNNFVKQPKTKVCWGSSTEARFRQ